MNTQNFEAFDKSTFTQFTNPALIHRDLETLNGIITGILSDDSINVKENIGLQEWLSETKPYENKQPYKAIIELLREALSDNFLTEEEGKNIIWLCNQYTKKNAYYDEFTADIQKLQGLIKGITIDNEINYEELSFLDSWLESNEHLKNTWPYDELYNITTSILADKVITTEEHNALLNFCNAITSNSGEGNSNGQLLKEIITGFYQIDPNIQFQEKTFCITGVSKKYKRKEIAEKIELYGGYVQNNISSKLNYLIVCDEKNTCWAFTCYGRKIEEAIQLRKRGHQLVIVHEYDLFDAFQNF